MATQAPEIVAAVVVLGVAVPCQRRSLEVDGPTVVNVRPAQAAVPAAGRGVGVRASVPRSFADDDNETEAMHSITRRDGTSVIQRIQGAGADADAGTADYTETERATLQLTASWQERAGTRMVTARGIMCIVRVATTRDVRVPTPRECRIRRAEPCPAVG